MQVEMIRAQAGTQMLTPLALIVVPTRELGAQIALLIYRMLGGSVRTGPNGYGPGDQANMFTYMGTYSLHTKHYIP